MSEEGLFRSPPRGIGADTGHFGFVYPARPEGSSPGPLVRHSLCLYEAENGRRNGPLLLSVMNSAVQQNAAIQGGLVPAESGGFAASVGGVGVIGEPDAASNVWTAYRSSVLAAALEIEVQVGSVRRVVYADFVPGTYQLPPYDLVKVGVVMRAPGDGPLWNINAAASVTPGRMQNARELTYTEAAFFDPDATLDFTRAFGAPEAGWDVRAFIATWEGDPTPFTAPAPVVTLGGAAYAAASPQLGGSGWFRFAPGCWQPQIWARFQGGGGGFSYWAGVQWRLDL